MESLNQIEASYEFFNRLGCCSEDLNGDFSDDTALALLEEDKMRCHIMNCLAALRVVQIRKIRKQEMAHNKNHEFVKRKVFQAACSLMIDTEFENEEDFVNTVLSSFPDEGKMSDERSWLPMHFAIVLFARNKISAENVHMLYTTDPLAMYRFSGEELSEEGSWAILGYTPAHLLCMQKEPNMSMVRFFCLRDPKAFLLCDQSYRCALHLVAQYSESVELLQAMMQIDQSMIKDDYEDDFEFEYKPLGLLCRRLEFPTLHEMVACLMEVDSSVEIIYDGIMGCLRPYRFARLEDLFLDNGSRGERSAILFGILLNANLDVMKYDNSHIFREVCCALRGKLGVTVLSLLHTKDSTGVKSYNHGDLPIHVAASYSSLCVLKFLHKAYPESLSILTDINNTLLHLAICDRSGRVIDMKDKVQYVCEQCPFFIHQKNDEGSTPLHDHFLFNYKLDIQSVVYLCSADASVVRDKCTPSDINNQQFERLPLHLLIANEPPRSEISNEGDCFRLFLRLYPASAGIKDGHLKSPYDLAISQDLSAYFIRLLLSADPTIDPEKRRNMNFAARRDGMFLAYRALSSNLEPTIWAKIRYEDKDLLARVISCL